MKLDKVIYLGESLFEMILDPEKLRQTGLFYLIDVARSEAEAESSNDFFKFTKLLIEDFIHRADSYVEDAPSEKFRYYGSTADFYGRVISFIVDDLAPVLNKVDEKRYGDEMRLESVVAMITDTITMSDVAPAAWATAAKWVAQALENKARLIRILNVKPLKERVKVIRAKNESAYVNLRKKYPDEKEFTDE